MTSASSPWNTPLRINNLEALVKTSVTATSFNTIFLSSGSVTGTPGCYVGTGFGATIDLTPITLAILGQDVVVLSTSVGTPGATIYVQSATNNIVVNSGNNPPGTLITIAPGKPVLFKACGNVSSGYFWSGIGY